jgi:hypothetical protein
MMCPPEETDVRVESGRACESIRVKLVRAEPFRLNLFGVEPILRHGNAVLDDALDRVVSPIEEQIELITLSAAEGLEDIVRWILPARRTADAHADTDGLARAEDLANAPQAIVATVPTPLLHAQRTKGDVEFVVDDDRAVYGDMEVVRQ